MELVLDPLVTGLLSRAGMAAEGVRISLLVPAVLREGSGVAMALLGLQAVAQVRARMAVLGRLGRRAPEELAPSARLPELQRDTVLEAVLAAAVVGPRSVKVVTAGADLAAGRRQAGAAQTG